MSTPRFYCAPDISDKLALDASIKLPDNAANHATRALRLSLGDDAILFNGDGQDYLAELTFVKKNEVTAKIKSIKPVINESPLRITLVQAISSGDRMDFTIQKAVEMGVTAIQPIASQRSVVKLSGERAEKRREHWQNVVISACEQSGRAVMPQVAAPLSLANWLAGAPVFSTRITLAPNASETLKTLAKPSGDICLLIGAEGGLTEDEISLAALQGFTPVRLGNRVLRTETAALAAIAAMQSIWGDFCS
ncbi:MAG TPA: 16S rRNA (uracil(1498)-N(3))-methyltransferase [Methylophilaceae bacterium]|nr:16S rRNA (uracil(1498)-N(3))-methyltransferase [Methylophilaceae bacterium]